MEPKKYKRYGMANKNSPMNGIFPNSANDDAPTKKKMTMKNNEMEVNKTGCQCFLTKSKASTEE